MAPGEILIELEALALRLGVTVRYEPFDARSVRRGGLCKLRGAPLVVLDPGLPVLDKIGVLAEALSAFDLAAIYVPPALRARLGGRAGSRVRPLLRGPVKAMPRVGG